MTLNEEQTELLWLEETAKRGGITAKTFLNARRLWKALKDYFGNDFKVPAQAAGPDGQLLWTWDKKDHHFEIEFCSEGEPETTDYFYRNRRKGFMPKGWLVETPIAGAIPEKAYVFLSKILLKES